MIEFIVEGKQIAKERPRKGKNGIFYTPKKTLDYEGKIVDSFLKLHYTKRKKYAKDIPLGIICTFCIQTPKSFSKVKRQKALNGEIIPKRKDVDNMLKTIMDALNKVAYEDDSQITEAIIRKKYAERDYTIVQIHKISDAIYSFATDKILDFKGKEK